LNFGGHGAVCNPIESGESWSTNCEIPLPTKKFSFGVHYKKLFNLWRNHSVAN
jgi:hypothetical protein